MSALSSSKLIQLLKSWDASELRAFEVWLKSPWCNSNKNLLPLFERLKKHHPTFDDPKLTKERLFRKILPDGKYSTRRINNLFSEAYMAAEQFLIFQQFSKDQNLQQRLRMQVFQSHHLEEWFFRDAQKTIDHLDEKDPKDWEDYLSLYQLNRQLYHHPNQEPRLQAGGAIIVRMGEQLDLLYLLEKATILNEKLFRNRILRDENHEVATDLKRWFAASEDIQHPAIELYRLRFAFMEQNQLSQYRYLRNLFLDKFEELNPKNQKEQLMSLINDTMYLIKLGQVDITECLPLYQLGLKTGMLLHQGQLTRNTYTSIVIASNTKGTFDFTDHFIDTYSKHLDAKLQSDCPNWAKAHTAYWKRDLETSLDILQQHNFKIYYLQLMSKVLQTQVYFDLFLKDASYQFYLFNYFDSFEKWLNREQLWSKKNKLSFLRFVQKCRALARQYSALDFEIDSVSKMLDGEKNIQALNWLQQRVQLVIEGRKGRPISGHPSGI